MKVVVQKNGQAVIPAALLQRLGIVAGDILCVFIDREENMLHIMKASDTKVASLAGSLSKYARRKKIPVKKPIAK